MESERTGQNVRNGPLHADPEPEPDTQDPKDKGTAYRTILEEPDEPGDAGDAEPDRP